MRLEKDKVITDSVISALKRASTTGKDLYDGNIGIGGSDLGPAIGS